MPTSVFDKSDGMCSSSGSSAAGERAGELTVAEGRLASVLLSEPEESSRPEPPQCHPPTLRRSCLRLSPLHLASLLLYTHLARFIFPCLEFYFPADPNLLTSHHDVSASLPGGVVHDRGWCLANCSRNHTSYFSEPGEANAVLLTEEGWNLGQRCR